MKCPNCGKDLDEKAKFCDSCGSKIDVVESPKEEIKNEEVVNKTKAQSTKKNPKALVFGIVGVILAAVVVGIALLALNKSSKADIKLLERAFSNTVKTGNKSGTVVATISMGDDKDNIDVSASVKYQKVSDGLKMQVTVNKSLFFDEMSLYGNITKNSIDLYAKNTLIDMFIGTASDEEKWLSLSYPIEDSTIDLNSISQIEQSDIALDSLKEFIKYSGKKDGLDCYTLVIDNKFIEKAKKEANSEQQQLLNQSINQLTNGSDKLEKPYNINFYVNSKEEIERITMDMEEYAKQINMKKLMLTVEFKDADSTVVTIPNEAITSSVDLETYIQENYKTDYDNDDSDFDFEFDDSDFDL